MLTGILGPGGYIRGIMFCFLFFFLGGGVLNADGFSSGFCDLAMFGWIFS